MATYYKVSILGAGNLGTHLARALEGAGHTVCEVWSRNAEHAEALAAQLYQAEPITDAPDLAQSEAQIFLLSVADDALREVADELVLPEGAVLAHCSGGRSMLEISGYGGTKGVFYPLQTFSRGRAVRWEGLPICIEAEDPETAQLLAALAGTLSREVYYLSHAERQTMHLAAVFASNFTNHMLAVAEHICQEHELQFHLLKPLIRETIEKALAIGPATAQTGPARRGDEATLALHLRLLGEDPALHKLYEVISQSIREN